jgi:carbon storage regulator
MLVIRRRVGESFRIGDDIEIQILESTGGQIKIGIQAPRSVSVLRTEVWVTASQNKMAASAAAAESLTETLVRQFFVPPPNSSSSSD